MKTAKTSVATLILALVVTMGAAAEDRKLDYQVLSTSRTSTMEKELNQAAQSGYRFLKVTNQPNVLGGKDLVVVTVKEIAGVEAGVRTYRVLSESRTSTLQKKLQAAAAEGYEYLDQTTLPNIVGGKNIVVFLERKAPKE
jgi:hypothetical protein